MSRRKKSSTLGIETAQKRAAGLEAIDPALDLGNGLSLAAFRAALVDTQTKMAAYNTLLSQSDAAQNIFLAADRNLRDLNDRMLAGIASKYGRDSEEYEQAGGTKKSERRRPVRRSAIQQPVAA